MANRELLHIKHLDALDCWMTNNGYDFKCDPYPFIVRQYTKPYTDTVCIYRRSKILGKKKIQHLSVQDKDLKLIQKFIKERKNGHL